MSSLRSWDAWLNSIWSIWVNFSCCLSFIIKWHLHTELAQVCIWILCFEVIPGSSLCFIRNFICFIWSWPCKPHRVRIQRVKDFYYFYNQNGCFFWFTSGKYTLESLTKALRKLFHEERGLKVTMNHSKAGMLILIIPTNKKLNLKEIFLHSSGLINVARKKFHWPIYFF